MQETMIQSSLTPLVREEYRALGPDEDRRRSAYRALFDRQIDPATIDALREATNKAWVLEDDRFRADIERKLNRRASPRPRGGDRRSEEFWRNRCSNRLWPHWSVVVP